MDSCCNPCCCPCGCCCGGGVPKELKLNMPPLCAGWDWPPKENAALLAPNNELPVPNAGGEACPNSDVLEGVPRVKLPLLAPPKGEGDEAPPKLKVGGLEAGVLPKEKVPGLPPKAEGAALPNAAELCPKPPKLKALLLAGAPNMEGAEAWPNMPPLLWPKVGVLAPAKLKALLLAWRQRPEQGQ